jgi:catechol 2,3-dioxygenase-like lactoylglutathione lyase family enzyme
MSEEWRSGAVLFAASLDRVAAFYAAVLGLEEAARDSDHIRLESPGFQLVVHRIVHGGDTTAGSSAPVRRASAAFKPVFFVPGIPTLRRTAGEHGGAFDPPEREWSFNGLLVCDAADPEGNVIQFREQAPRGA